MKLIGFFSSDGSGTVNDLLYLINVYREEYPRNNAQIKMGNRNRGIIKAKILYVLDSSEFDTDDNRVTINARGLYGVYTIYDSQTGTLNLSDPGAPNTTGSYPWDIN